MNFLIRCSRGIDRVTAWIGKGVAWLILVAVLVSAANAIIRKAFDLSSNAWLELQWYLFGAVFMLAAAWTLQKNEHVRIDVVSAHLSRRTRLWVDLACHILFLMPFVVLMTRLSWPFFLRSITTGEYSMNAGGLILWPAKALVLAGFVVLVFQGISEIIKTIAMLKGDLPMPAESEEEQLPPELREHAQMMEETGGADRA
ncbi:TRAP transporter small permease subunit [Mangrovicoccus algicola]|uniref:TRAP transporter small permease protein n=1 Tax=Mangrovicoccus algicola TaxID=2771008 RepID=A0A8J6YVH5_9RHOB|nr:TRAP transporter small permease subunit [Mangrovicoccus algicola]MBE3638522.1 TRAP transporter small permease subunit [Mangrovicoccus algicola]